VLETHEHAGIFTRREGTDRAFAVKYWEIIADRLSNAGWSWGYTSLIDSAGQLLFTVDAHCADGRRYRLGFVSEKDIDAAGHLAIIWQAQELLTVDLATKEEKLLIEPTLIETESSLNLRIRTLQKQFSLGDRLQFTPTEHNHTMFTFYVFTLEIVQSIEKLQHPTTAENVGP